MAALAEAFARAWHDFGVGHELRPGLHFRACLSQEAGEFIGVLELDDRRVFERCVHEVVFGDSVGGQRFGGLAPAYHAALTASAGRRRLKHLR